jgi:hypothetical protein
MRTVERAEKRFGRLYFISLKSATAFFVVFERKKTRPPEF